MHTFPHRPLEGINLIFDGANGAAAAYGARFLSQLGAKVIAVGDKPSGKNINDGCGSEHGAALGERVTATENVDLAIALDGDGDRVLVTDCQGKVVSGEHFLATLAFDLQQRGELSPSCVVTTVAANSAFDRALHDHGIAVHRCAVGDSHVAAAMKTWNINLGGEPSGHILCGKFSPIADGLFAAVAFVRALAKQSHRFCIASLPHYFPLYPCATVNIPVVQKIPLEGQPVLQKTIGAIHGEMESDGAGRTLVRYSGTENKLRILVEAISEERAKEFAQRIAAVARNELRK
jgi:phosphoglucosamine mutase